MGLIVVGALLALAGIGNLIRGRGGKMTRNGILLLVIGIVLIVIGWASVEQ